MAGHAVQAVEAFHGLLQKMLDKARAVKQTDTIEPPLAKTDLTQLLQRVESIEHLSTSLEANKSFRYAVIETAIRCVFNDLLASSNIDSSEFVNIWDLLDIVSILSDDELCDPALGFWLVEELLDNQTIAGCRKVFDYLESRRERMTAKHFKQKELVILRSCKELLRRLSRAEDTAFCGRVYVFMFQSFPLGDKSSVNLRGEYHVENVTTFDELPQKTQGSSETMDVDSETMSTPAVLEIDYKIIPTDSPSLSKPTEDPRTAMKSVSSDAKDSSDAEKSLDPDTLYPIFWSLQQSFSQPKRLFDQANLSEFKKGLEATMVVFKSVQNDQSGRNAAKSIDEGKRGIKRKRGQRGDDLATTFNPKYLTSRDLFELEISDLSFRRHVLVQALIIMDFLVSLSPKAKEKLTTIKAQNKSVMYQEQVLSEDDTKWAIETKKSIAEYLKQGFEGPFFYRMVETVLSRDKNWVRWKIESCPPIERPAVSLEEHLAAKAAARKATTNRRLRAKPLGSLDLGFLNTSNRGVENLKDSSRYRLPTLNSFKDKIALDDLEIQMPTSNETKEAAINSKASKSWRALRIASINKLATFDKIKDSLENFNVIFQDDQPELDTVKEEGQDLIDAETIPLPDDRRPVIISGPGGVGKSTVVKMLIDKYSKVYAKRVAHTTRPPNEGEIDGVHYHFVDVSTFNIMRDGDQLLEFDTEDGYDYGTSLKAIESIIASGKIPIMEMSCQRAQKLRDLNYPVRLIFLAAPTTEELKRRLRLNNAISEKKAQAKLEAAKEDIKHFSTEGFYEKAITNDDLKRTIEELERHLFGRKFENGLPAVNSEEPIASTGVVERMEETTVVQEAITASEVLDVPMA